MPALTEEAADRYPMFEKWMRQDFVHVISNPRIMKAFFKWSDFSAGDSPASRIYFNYGMPPMIGIFTQDCDYNSNGTPVLKLHFELGPRVKRPGVPRTARTGGRFLPFAERTSTQIFMLS